MELLVVHCFQPQSNYTRVYDICGYSHSL